MKPLKPKTVTAWAVRKTHADIGKPWDAILGVFYYTKELPACCHGNRTALFGTRAAACKAIKETTSWWDKEIKAVIRPVKVSVTIKELK